MYYDPMISKLCTYSFDRNSTINEMTNALDRYFIEGVQTNKDFLSNILQNKDFKEGVFSTSFIADNYPQGYNSKDITIKDKEILYCVATFINYKYLMRAASISNQLKGFNRTVGNVWNIIDKTKHINVKLIIIISMIIMISTCNKHISIKVIENRLSIILSNC